jgi:CheY-like chemotaxis protein
MMDSVQLLHNAPKETGMSEVAILCVDDEKVILDSLKRQLKRWFGNKYVYEMAESAADAWDVIEELRVDEINVVVVVSDWLMPGMKGDEFLIRLHERFPHVVTILLTGQADRHAVERTKQQANLHRFLNKPWNEEELYAAITSGLKSI